MNPSITSLVPPVILFAVACMTGNILKAFAFGIFTALFIIGHANPLIMINLLIQQTIEYFTDPNVIVLFFFLICIGSIITILSIVRERITKKNQKKETTALIKTARMSEYAIMFSSFLFGIDDYLSILTVGFLANQFAKKFAISKERIAYIVHGLSGPFVILVPISSWAAEIISQLYQAGVHTDSITTTTIAADPLFLYLQSMSYNFYSLLTILSIWFFIQSQAKIEKSPLKQQNLSTNNTEKSIPTLDIAIPLFVLLSLTCIGLLYTGDCFIFGGNNSVFTALSKNHATFYVLFISSVIAFIVLFLYEWYQKNIHVAEIFIATQGGFQLMKNAIALVALASIFGVFVRRDLMVGTYLAHTLLMYIGQSFVPFAIFITALLIALVTGTSWGTFALMIPIVIQMLITNAGITTATGVEQIPFLLPSLGAIFSGGVCGDHISPFSETTIMTATMTELSSVQHAKSQFFYVLPAIITTTLLFLLIGFMPTILSSILVHMIIGSILCLILIFLVKFFLEKNNN